MEIKNITHRHDDDDDDDDEQIDPWRAIVACALLSFGSEKKRRRNENEFVSIIIHRAWKVISCFFCS